jgi:hypothetical protein
MTETIKKEIIVDGVSYIPKIETSSSIKIVILQRGWVMIAGLQKRMPYEDGAHLKV